MTSRTSVLFVCLHGSAKSVVAAAHLQRLAAARGLWLDCASAGVEPDESVPPHVVAGLAADGLNGVRPAPLRVTAETIEAADHVISFGCDLPAPPSNGRLRIWGDVPAVSDGYESARDAILKRVGQFLDEIGPTLRRPAGTATAET